MNIFQIMILRVNTKVE